MSEGLLVVGGSGRLGQLIVEQAQRRSPLQVLLGDYDLERGKRIAHGLGVEARHVDVTDEATVRAAMDGVRAVVVAIDQPRPVTQLACHEAGIPCVDVTPSDGPRRFVEALGDGPPSVTHCGYLPGLSGLLLEHTASRLDTVERLDLTLVQSTNARVGASGALAMLDLLARPVPHPDSGEVIRGFSVVRSVALPDRSRTWSVRLFSHDEAPRMQDRLGAPVHYWTGWDRPAQNRLVAGLLRLGGSRWLPSAPRWALDAALRHAADQPETTFLVAEATGPSGTVSDAVEADSDYGATAWCVVQVLREALATSRRGPVLPLDLLTLPQMLGAGEDAPVRLHS